MAVSEYQVLESSSTAALNALVATAIAAGWQPNGAAFSRMSNQYPERGTLVCQALIKGAPVATNTANVNEVVTAANVIDASESGAIFHLDNVTGFASTLPAPALGLSFTFINRTANTTGNHTIVTNGSANIIKGNQNSVFGDAGDFGAADDTISFVAASSVAGDKVRVFSDGVSWFAYAISRVAAGVTFTQASV